MYQTQLPTYIDTHTWQVLAKAVLGPVGPLLGPQLGIFYPGHNLWDSVQNKTSNSLSKIIVSLKMATVEHPWDNNGTLLNREPCVTTQLSGPAFTSE